MTADSRPRGRPRNEPKSELGRWFRREEKAGRISIEELASIAEVSVNRAYVLLAGKKITSLSTAVKIIEHSRKRPQMQAVEVDFFLPDE